MDRLKEASPVIAGLSRAKPIALWASIPAFCLGLVLFSGCDLHSYSKDMRYPVRSDVITEPLVADAPPFAPPGQWEYLLPSFAEKGGKTLDPADLTSEQREAFQKTLDDIFGSPAEPTVKGIESEARNLLKLDDVRLAQGSQLYRRHCLHCHGLTGDGHGPTAPWVNPHPRDYRPGKFKFVSVLTGDSAKPKRSDLLRTLRQGVEGTSMPSFGLLESEELESLVSYVIHLSMRGQVELAVMTGLLKDKSQAAGKIASEIKGDEIGLPTVVQDWLDAENAKQPIPYMPYPINDDNEEERHASITRGFKLFIENCITCHKDYGRQSNYKFDAWNTIVRPRDLTLGVYRGGRRPIDIYWRIRGGIKAGAMPEVPFTPEQVWDLVNFVRALPYKPMLPEDISKQIYPPDTEESASHAAARRD
jgi:mono/diheme cytochrome c family protein